METVDAATAYRLFAHYRTNREGISEVPAMASVCLICGSRHIVPKEGEPHLLVCRNCGFAFYRYDCPACGATVDGRDPRYVKCAGCGLRICSCGACHCPPAAESSGGEPCPA